MGGSSFVDWLRKPLQQQWHSSVFWKGLTKSIPVLLHWLRWRVSSGKSILIGLDKIVGLEESSILNKELREQLSKNRILVLAHASELGGIPSLPGRWRSSSSLGLSGQLALEWDKFTIALKDAGISLQAGEYSLIWVARGGMLQEFFRLKIIILLS